LKKIKIIHVLYSFEIGGIESLVLQFCQLMNCKKYEMHIITLINESLQLANMLPPQIKIYSLNLNKAEIKSVYGLFKGFKELQFIFNSLKPDIVHNHLVALPFLFTTLAIKSSKIISKHIRTVHTAGIFYENQYDLSSKINLIAEKTAMKVVNTYIVGVSRTVDENNRKHFINIARDIRLIVNGVDLIRYDKDRYRNESKKIFGVSENYILVSYVARLSHEKNHELLIDIWSDVLREVPNVVLVIAGDGELSCFLKQKVVNLNLENSIKFLGLINNVPQLLSVTDIGVFPSSYEGFGLALIENFAMKIPVIASDIKSFRSIAKNGYDAFLLPIDNRNNFMRKIVELCRDSKLRNEVGGNAYKTAQKYSIQKTIFEYDQYYGFILKN